MGYLGSSRGDYLGAARGDPGLFGFLGGLGKGIARTVGGFVPGPAGMILRTVGRKAPVLKQQQPRFAPAPPPITMRGINVGGPRGITVGTRRFGPTAPMPAPVSVDQFGQLVRKRRRMNVANPKALRRSIRRQAGFVKLARRALQGSGYKIVSRGASSRPKRVSIRESGPGGVSVS